MPDRKDGFPPQRQKPVTEIEKSSGNTFDALRAESSDSACGDRNIFISSLRSLRPTQPAKEKPTFTLY